MICERRLEKQQSESKQGSGIISHSRGFTLGPFLRFLYFLANKFVSHSCVYKFFTLIFSFGAPFRSFFNFTAFFIVGSVLNQHSIQTTCLIITIIWVGIFINFHCFRKCFCALFTDGISRKCLWPGLEALLKTFIFPSVTSSAPRIANPTGCCQEII